MMFLFVLPSPSVPLPKGEGRKTREIQAPLLGRGVGERENEILILISVR